MKSVNKKSPNHRIRQTKPIKKKNHYLKIFNMKELKDPKNYHLINTYVGGLLPKAIAKSGKDVEKKLSRGGRVYNKLNK